MSLENIAIWTVLPSPEVDLDRGSMRRVAEDDLRVPVEAVAGESTATIELKREELVLDTKEEASSQDADAGEFKATLMEESQHEVLHVGTM